MNPASASPSSYRAVLRSPSAPIRHASSVCGLCRYAPMKTSATPDAARLPHAGPRYAYVSRYAKSMVTSVSPTAIGHVCLIRSTRRRFRASNSACAELPAADETRSAAGSGGSAAIAIVPRHFGNVEHPQNCCLAFGPRPAVRSTISDEQRGQMRAPAVK